MKPLSNADALALAEQVIAARPSRLPAHDPVVVAQWLGLMVEYCSMRARFAARRRVTPKQMREALRALKTAAARKQPSAAAVATKLAALPPGQRGWLSLEMRCEATDEDMLAQGYGAIAVACARLLDRWKASESGNDANVADDALLQGLARIWEEVTKAKPRPKFEDAKSPAFDPFTMWAQTAFAACGRQVQPATLISRCRAIGLAGARKQRQAPDAIAFVKRKT